MGTNQHPLPEGVYTYAGRLASFDVTYQFQKARASSAKSKAQNTVSWPHKNPSPKKLAMAGFFYRPTAGSSDSVECFLCRKALDGWEEDDDTIAEHLKHSPDCGWAINLRIDQKPDGTKGDNEEDPLCQKMMAARRATFADRWPHENKKGWTCKTNKMVDAGWFYSPTPESDDFVTCAYCGLALDGWEPKDDPLKEHHRRSNKCPFFTMMLTAPVPAVSKPTKAKKGRASKALSKASRTSVQSANWEVFSGNSSLAELVLEEGNSFMSTLSTVSRQTATGRKIIAPKGKKTKAKKDGPVELSSYIEPEDDSFEVKVPERPARATRERKRKTIEEVVAEFFEDPVTQAAPPKRRATRTRNSLARVQTAPVAVSHAQDTETNDANAIEHAPVKRAGKAGRKSRTSTAKPRRRKLSTASNASKAPLRAGPSDLEIELALEADLDRPLTDDEDEEVKDEGQPKGRRLTRSRVPSAKVAASVAPAKKVPATSTAVSDDVSMTELVNIADSYLRLPPGEGLPTRAKRAPSRQPSRQASRQMPKRVTRASVLSVAESVAPPSSEIDRSNITGDADSGDETDVSMASQSTILREGTKRKAAATKKGKPAKKVMRSSRNVEDIIQRHLELHLQEPQHEEVIEKQKPTQGRLAKAKAATKGQGTRKAKAAKAATEKTTPPATSEQETDEKNDTEVDGGVQSTPAPPVAPVEAAKPKAMKAKKNVPKAKAKSPVAEIAPVATETEDKGQEQRQQQLTPEPSNSSDAENQPPSSRISAPTPMLSQTTRVPLAASTPNAWSPSKRNIVAGLQTSFPWTTADLETVFLPSPKKGDKENTKPSLEDVVKGLASPEKRMTVQDWIKFNAQRETDRLEKECERLVTIFETRANSAMQSLEGIELMEG